MVLISQRKIKEMKKMPNIPWSKASKKVLKQVKGICFDIDDTLSTAGKLHSKAFNYLWRLKKSGYYLVPITGRCAGWCDHIARFWPVDAVIGENGAFVFYMQDSVLRRFNTITLGNRNDLNNLAEEIAKEFPAAKWASDQLYRESDLAIDICEDVAPWSEVDVKRLIEFCQQRGAKAKLSSIHVNTWYGDYDKAKTFKLWLAQGAMRLPANTTDWIFIGDSPNDAPMFALFDKSVAVSNIRPYLSSLRASPTWITSKSSGDGFSEFAKQLLDVKEGRS